MNSRLRWGLTAAAWVALDVALWAGWGWAMDWQIGRIADLPLEAMQAEFVSGRVAERLMAFGFAYIGVAFALNALLIVLAVRALARGRPNVALQPTGRDA